MPVGPDMAQRAYDKGFHDGLASQAVTREPPKSKRNPYQEPKVRDPLSRYTLWELGWDDARAGRSHGQFGWETQVGSDRLTGRMTVTHPADGAVIDAANPPQWRTLVPADDDDRDDDDGDVLDLELVDEDGDDENDPPSDYVVFEVAAGVWGAAWIEYSHGRPWRVHEFTTLNCPPGSRLAYMATHRSRAAAVASCWEHYRIATAQ